MLDVVIGPSRDDYRETRSDRSPNAIENRLASPRGSLEGLLELRSPRFNLNDVVLNERLLSRIEDVLRQQRKRDWLREHGKNTQSRGSRGRTLDVAWYWCRLNRVTV